MTTLIFPLRRLAREFRTTGPDRWDEEEKADGVGEKAGGQEDRSGEENHETVERFLVGHASFAGGLLEFRHGEAALGFGQGSADDRSDNDDRDGVGKPKLGAQGQEEVELGQGDEDEEKEEFSKHGSLLRENSASRWHFHHNQFTEKSAANLPPERLAAIGPFCNKKSQC